MQRGVDGALNARLLRRIAQALVVSLSGSLGGGLAGSLAGTLAGHLGWSGKAHDFRVARQLRVQRGPEHVAGRDLARIEPLGRRRTDGREIVELRSPADHLIDDAAG